MTGGPTRRDLLRIGVFATLSAPAARARPVHEPVPDGRPHHLTFVPDGFALDGQPFQIRAGELHPVRIPRSCWRQRIQMVRAMGLNTVSVYIMWNVVEPQPGRFVFDDRGDISAFLELCRAEGMWVYLRPGPYVCAEWDLGGLPAWLLYEGDVRLRTTDPAFLSPASRYIALIASLVAPYMASNGGPILMLQVENEYASFGHDRTYLEAIATCWRSNGIEGPFSIADGLPQLRAAGTTLHDVAVGLDGETAPPGTLSPGGPVWISEAYPGWLTHWGDKSMARVDFESDFRTILKRNLSFSLYVAHGGTNFGFGAGANAGHDGGRFQPVVTSYDYDAPITENGHPSAKYQSMRAMLAGVTGRPSRPLPELSRASDFQPVMARHGGDPRLAFGRAVSSDIPQSLETALHQPHGIGRYTCMLPAGPAATLHLGAVHDVASVFLDQTDIGTVSRVWREGQPPHPDTSIAIPARAHPARLEVLIDSFGHIGYGPALGDRKGLLGPVMLGDMPVTGWKIQGLSLDEADVARLRALPETTPRAGLVLFRADVHLETVADIYVDLGTWPRGYAWVNGHLLGRYWSMGPQRRLFCPAEFWRQGSNDIMLLDWHATDPHSISGFADAGDA
ncbi:beta-galactosidase [Tanticharoenia sakaeratensis]|uniref:Beta-galactosidase n=1 Tax=Tanticharoenia sakaeratensis NBRC 103193 TaxID=1231623 RepID=A0A0D6MM23_9PROT|nr:beta-galactosidase [Tanticharoenia sakaeratensis]GAN54318.1 beta-galactosidase [Tanticharoenia sakaeratensis NBRC 103193]GBQ18964.1 beta-galactosidase [Tanticharoenia sakaeratensis NBRC 103193]